MVRAVKDPFFHAALPYATLHPIPADRMPWRTAPANNDSRDAKAGVGVEDEPRGSAAGNLAAQ